MLNVTSGNGTLSVLYFGYGIKDVSVSVIYDGGHYNRLVKSSGEWTTEKTADGYYLARSGAFGLKFREIDGGFTVKASYTAGEKIAHAILFRAFSGLTDEITEAVVNGFSESNGNRFNEMQAAPHLNRLVRNQSVVSSDSVAAKFSGGKVAAIGAATFEKYFTEIELNSDGEVAVGQRLDFKSIETGETIESDEIAFVPGAGFGDALERYARVTAMFNPREIKPAPVGWCSWYYYGPNISADIIRENMRALKTAKVPVNLIQIDDGWAKTCGDWEPNERFGDMKALADEIRAAGYTPGIWIAPFAADENSEVYRDHPEWFVKNLDDDGIFGYPSMDFSHPGAAEHLKKIFSTISREWGYRYIKIDLVLHAISAGRHFDRSFNAIRNYRRALRIINEAVTPDTYLISCTAPIGASTGLVDGARTSSDIFEDRESVRKISLQNFRRYYYGGRAFNVDFDCFLARTAKNEDEQCFRLCTRADDEIKTHAATVAASGGAIVFSDKIKLLDEKQIALYKTIINIKAADPKPLDFDTADLISAVDGGKADGVRTIYFFNFGEKTAAKSMTLPKKSRVYAVWKNADLGETDVIRAVMPAFSSEVFFVGDEKSVAAKAKELEFVHKIVF